MWEGLDTIDWAGLRHNYGSADDVPALLRRCAGPDREDAWDAAGDLHNLLFHQGGWVCSAASAALPYLVRLAARPEVPARRERLELLDLLTRLSGEAVLVTEAQVDPAWGPAWERALPEVLGLLSDPDPAIRRAVADLLGSCGSPGARTLPALLTRWEAEEDPATRLDLVIALGHAARREPTAGLSDRTTALLRGLLDGPEPQLRLAAVHALAPADPGLATRHLGLVLDAVRDPSVELWRQTSTADCGVVGVQGWTADLLPGASPSYVLGLLADHPDPEQRAGALGQAGGLLSRWRSAVPAVLPAVAARLDDPDTEVRYRSVELIACLGSAGADHADAVAALLDDTATRSTRTGEAVREAAVWALARLGDPRCVPAVVDLVAAGGRATAFGTAAVHHTRYGTHHYSELPGIHELLTPLREHADALLPSIRAHLRSAHLRSARLHSARPTLARPLCEVLAAWGPAASPAVPELLDLLADAATWAPAATALAGIRQPAGEEALALLRARTTAAAGATATGTDAELAAWAYWQLGGEPEPALAVLGPAATDGSFVSPALRKLADLGPHAAPYADRLRALVADPYDWVSVEAAHALWAATGDTDTAVPALLDACRSLPTGTYYPAMLQAVRHLTRIGAAARPAATVLAEALPRDERFGTSGAWRAFVDDETIRAAVTELCRVTAATPPPAAASGARTG
ncbi:HEAT repeat domain-containing protein [Kitasatospora sp. NPDC097691]|uniref:HEAT repeat domain-containing protein n=1 Tax=Kitasatospora sp. NPDC097691 TaxID=3157231 RepID=UPI0033292732